MKISGVVIRQEQELRECKNRLEELQLRMDQKFLRITGVQENKKRGLYPSGENIFQRGHEGGEGHRD